MSEKAIKSLQKEVLINFETHLLEVMQPEHFNALRKLVFRSTFLAYRLGILGLDRDETSYEKLYRTAAGALQDVEHSPLADLEADLREEVLEYILRTWLEAFRLGAIAHAERPRAI